MEKGENNMLSIKEYADRQGVSIQAIYQSLKSQENLERLKDHIFMENGRKMLDDYAVKVLDESRKQNPVVIMQISESERIADLERENERLTQAFIELQDKLIKKQEHIQEMQEQLLQTKEHEMQLITSKSEIKSLNEKIGTLQESLEKERAKTWLDKLFKR